MAKTGRKLKLTPAFIAEAAKLIGNGNTVSNVAPYMGITETTWYRWMEKGEESTIGIMREFYESIKKAQPVARIAAISGILQAGKEGNWQAFAWYLERTDPDNFGRKDRIKQEITGKDGGPVQVAKAPDLSKLTDEELTAYARLCEKLGDGDVPPSDA
jgi:hypothetical protein